MAHRVLEPIVSNDRPRPGGSLHAQCRIHASGFRHAVFTDRHAAAHTEGVARWRAMALVLALLAGPLAFAESPPPRAARFSGSATLTAPPAQSADRRYSIVARLDEATPPSSGRFALDARLLAGADATAGACAATSDLIFAHGFEN
jgi:hypothetical protein